MMTRIRLLFILVLLSGKCFAQIYFESGYFIEKSGKRINCKIRDVDWKNNPKEFTFQLDAEGDNFKKNVDEVIEFGIETEQRTVRFISALVNIDRSSDIESKLTSSRLPVWEKELLFLKVLIEGKANLYYYEDKNLRRFFFDTAENDSIQQLVYKRYRPEATIAKTNNTFRQQLLNYVSCEGLSNASVKKLAYNSLQITNYFKDYNTNCSNGFKELKDASKRKSVSMKLTAGMNYSSLTLPLFTDNLELVFLELEDKFLPRLGFELEFILPFKKNKWRLVSDPGFHYYVSEPKDDDSIFTGNEYEYYFFEIPLGLRYYMFLNDRNKLFFTSTYAYDLLFDNENTLGSGTFTAGMGTEIKKLSLEARFFLTKNIDFAFEKNRRAGYRRIMFNIGYRIF